MQDRSGCGWFGKQAISGRPPVVRCVAADSSDIMEIGHAGFASRADWNGMSFGRRLGRRRFGLELEIERRTLEGKLFALGRMMQAEIADFDESLWEDVLEESADEFEWGHGAGTHALIIAVTVTEANGLIVGMEDGGIGDGDAVEVAGEIAQGLFAGADGRGMDNPFACPDGRRDGCGNGGELAGKTRSETGSENCGEGV